MLKFNVGSIEFAEALDKVVSAATVTKDKGTVIESCIQIKIFRDRAFQKNLLGVVLAFDTKKQLISSFQISDVESEEGVGEFYVSGKRISDVAKAFAATDTILNITVDTELRIEGAGSVLKLPLGNKITFIQAEKKGTMEIEMKTKELQQLLRYGGCAFHSAPLSNLDCVYLEFSKKNKQTIAVSSDSIRIAYAETKEVVYPDEKVQEDMAVLIDAEQLKALGKILSTEKVSIKVSPKQLYLKCGTDVAILLTKEGNFPIESIREVKDSKKGAVTLKISNQDMLNALCIFEIGTLGTKQHLEIVSVNEKQICFKSKENTAETSISVAQKGEFEKIGLDEKLFKQVLSVFPRNKEIYMFIGDEDMPIQIREEEDAENVIMMCIIRE